jgi:hypothetical protein
MKDTIAYTNSAAVILWADGLQHRKPKVLPGVSNQDWPKYTEQAFARINDTAVRLSILEELLNGNTLYVFQLKAEYERRVEELHEAHP